MFNKFFFVEMTAIKPHMFRTGSLHFTIDRPCHNISRCKVFSVIIFFHERFAVFITKNTAITTNCFSN